nr:MAG TPA: hypothetical protein [Caudoviricetes sp.]
MFENSGAVCFSSELLAVAGSCIYPLLKRYPPCWKFLQNVCFPCNCRLYRMFIANKYNNIVFL